MTDAYKCDGCNELQEGYPALDIDFDSMARAPGGDAVLRDGTRVEWSLRHTDAEFCPTCAVGIIEKINEAMV